MAAASVACADPAQTDLARQIEAASLTQNAPTDPSANGMSLYPPLSFRREMQVKGCDVTSLVSKLGPAASDATRIGEITFDLARTIVPVPDTAMDPAYLFVAPKANGATGTAFLHFIFQPPYTPDLAISDAGQTRRITVAATPFMMEPIADQTQPRRLLDLLRLYQSEYCLPQS